MTRRAPAPGDDQSGATAAPYGPAPIGAPTVAIVAGVVAGAVALAEFNITSNQASVSC